MPQQQSGGGRGAAAQTDEGPSKFQQAFQAIGIFLLVQFAISHFFGKPSTTSVQTADGAKVAVPSTVPPFDQRATPVDHTLYNPVPQLVAPIWPADSSLDVDVLVSPSLVVQSTQQASIETWVVHERKIKLDNSSDERTIDTVINVPNTVQHNGSWYLHFHVGLHGAILDPTSSEWDSSKAYHFVRLLNQYWPKKKVVKKKSLLGGSSDDNSTETEDVEEEQVPKTKGRPIASYYHPNFTISLVPDSGVNKYPTMHPAVRQHMHLEASGARDESGQNGWYYPMLFVNTFWQLRDQMVELNSTVSQVPLHITLNTMANWKMSLYATMDEGMKQTARQAASGGPIPAGGDGSELEEFKRVLVDTNIYLLSTTVAVSLLHMVFEFLAFKSDVSHWRNKKDNVGVSVRTILANVVMQLIIFLYLFDNSDGTSWMILLGQGVGILVEAWKITRAVDVRIRPSSTPGALIPYRITFEDKHQLTETEQKTQEYDEIAFRYLFWVAVPLLLAYAGYSLVYEEHKSWYSFVIATLVGSVYAYGFLMMVPSLYINYRLKSVAHMPAKTMTYKFLNTFIDDLFAFTVKMPTLHRLATLRDDVIFFIYLYQAYAYKVDYSRVNEFGQGGDEDEDEKGKDKAVPSRPESAQSGSEKPLPKVPSRATGAETSTASPKKRK